MPGYTLDTDIVIALLKGDIRLLTRIQTAQASGASVSIGALPYCEILRGFEKLGNPVKLAAFQAHCQSFGVLLVDSLSILVRAARIWADLSVKGMLLEDADILIAATALEKGCVLVTDDSDFQRVPGLGLENWLV